MQSIKTRQLKGKIKSLISKLKVMKLYKLLIEIWLPIEITELGKSTYNESSCRVHTSAKACDLPLWPSG